ncbi:hypothetical protein [Xenorhabdus sp. TS4]|uniref:hypothetical protein n=1 Tax=Xenorhabdus sp. TS4 TaxID=1873483 RepID=UPI001656CF54|nr:hypothetical protein [Xenorhabdus sp. TS4]
MAFALQSWITIMVTGIAVSVTNQRNSLSNTADCRKSRGTDGADCRQAIAL